MICKYCGKDGVFPPGRLKCKACRSVYHAKWSAAHVDMRREYEIARSGTPKAKAAARAATLKWRRRHAARLRAHGKANYAQRLGQLAPPAACELCGRGGRVEKHHQDYSQPFDVLWFCKSCHVMADKARRYIETASKEDNV